jgi:RimJ/RimL family protein N-acetyltransferase
MTHVPTVSGPLVRLRPIATTDLERAAEFLFTLSITEPLTDLTRLREVFEATGFWLPESGALAIEELATGRLLGTTQFYRSGACIHGYEIGYVLHSEADWGRGFGSDALRLMSQVVFDSHPDCYRLQLIIETWNDASWHLAERCGYQREGIMRMAGYSSTVPEDCYLYSLVAATRSMAS